MPNLKLSNLASFKAYFAAIAASHVDIAGYKFGTKDIVMNENRSLAMASFLWAMPYDNVRYTDNHSDNIVKTKQARVAFMKVRQSELFADEDADFQFCEGVIEQIIAKMLIDKTGSMQETSPGVNEWVMVAFNSNGMTTGPVEKLIGSTKYIGWELRIDIIDNTNLAYNAAKWS
jgi:hypothetical protein